MKIEINTDEFGADVLRYALEEYLSNVKKELKKLTEEDDLQYSAIVQYASEADSIKSALFAIKRALKK